MGALPVVRMELELGHGPLHRYVLLKMHHLTAAGTAARPSLSWASGNMGSAQSERSRGVPAPAAVFSSPRTGRGLPVTVALWSSCHRPERVTRASEEAEGHRAAQSSSQEVARCCPSPAGRDAGETCGPRQDTAVCCWMLGILGLYAALFDTDGETRC